MWDLQGRRVTGKYLGQDLCSGVITESRVALGGRVKHVLALDNPMQFRWRTLPSTHIILNHDEILTIEGNESSDSLH